MISEVLVILIRRIYGRKH